jgi:5-methylcytosine-specific restriction endonuclease McrA
MSETKNSNADARSRGEWQGMNWIRQEKRLAIYLRDGLACGYCGDSVENGAKLSLDHLKPHIAEAKELISRRGSAAQVLASHAG